MTDTELVEPAEFLRQCAATVREQADADDTGEGEAMGRVFDIAAMALDVDHRCQLVGAVLDLAINLSGVEVVDTPDAAAV